MKKKRIAFGLITGTVAEIANKAFPLITLHVAASRLGVEGFGISQFTIWLVDLAVLFVVFGYGSAAPILWREAESPEARRLVLGQTLCARLIHAALASALLFAACSSYGRWEVYLPILAPSLFTVIVSAFDMLWALAALQLLPVFSLLTLVAKTVSVVAIFVWVRDPGDVLFYTLTVLLANAIISLGSFAFVVRKVGISWPDFSGVKKVFAYSLPYALSFILLVALERFDVFFVEARLGAEGAANYGGPLKLIHSVFPVIAMINSIFYSELLAVYDQDKATGHLFTGLRIAVLITMPIGIGVWFVGGDLLALILDDYYARFGHLLSLLSLMLLAQVFILFFSYQVLLLRKKVRSINIALAAGLFVGIGATWLGLRTEGLIGAAVGSVFGKWVAACMIVAFSAAALRVKIIGVITPWLSTTVPGALMGVVLYAVETALPGLFWGWTVLVGAVSYCAAVAGMFRTEVRFLLSKVRSRRL